MSGEMDIRQLIFLALPAMMLLGSICSALLAQFKGRDATHWMIWSFLFPPTVLLLFFVSKSDGGGNVRSNKKSPRKKPARRAEDDESDGTDSFIMP